MGGDAYDPDLARRKFAEERSHKDAGVSNESIRATAQAAILINGGAATAILAFLAKEGIDSTIARTAPLCLVGYALGVAAGFAAMYCSIRSLDQYQMRWRLEAHPEAKDNAERRRQNGLYWWTLMRYCLYASILSFLGSSVFVANSISKSNPVQSSAPTCLSTCSSPPPAAAAPTR